MRPERPFLCLEPGLNARRLDFGRESRRRLGSRPQSKPDHANETSTLEGTQLAQVQIKGGQGPGGQPFRNLLDDNALDVADETDGQVEIGGRRPAEVRRGLRTPGDKVSQRSALRLGHR